VFAVGVTNGYIWLLLTAEPYESFLHGLELLKRRWWKNANIYRHTLYKTQYHRHGTNFRHKDKETHIYARTYHALIIDRQG